MRQGCDVDAGETWRWSLLKGGTVCVDFMISGTWRREDNSIEYIEVLLVLS